MLQTVLIVVLALILGADFKGGVIGVIVMFFIGALLAASVASFSNAVGVLGRQRETVIGIVSFFQLPLTFLSTGMMQKNLLPHWMQTVAMFNPVNWAVVAARAAAMQKTDWGVVGTRVALLAASRSSQATWPRARSRAISVRCSGWPGWAGPNLGGAVHWVGPRATLRPPAPARSPAPESRRCPRRS